MAGLLKLLQGRLDKKFRVLLQRCSQAGRLIEVVSKLTTF